MHSFMREDVCNREQHDPNQQAKKEPDKAEKPKVKKDTAKAEAAKVAKEATKVAKSSHSPAGPSKLNFKRLGCVSSLAPPASAICLPCTFQKTLKTAALHSLHQLPRGPKYPMLLVPRSIPKMVFGI